jgi:hypothetical protein
VATEAARHERQSALRLDAIRALARLRRLARRGGRHRTQAQPCDESRRGGMHAGLAMPRGSARQEIVAGRFMRCCVAASCHSIADVDPTHRAGVAMDRRVGTKRSSLRVVKLRRASPEMRQMTMGETMKVSALLVAVGLAACQDLAMSGDAGSGMGGDDPTGDPRDDPFLADINNAWGDVLGKGYHFTFAANPDGKNSSVVVGGSGTDPSGTAVTVDGIFYDHTVHLTVTQGANVLTFNGIFVSVELMDLTVEESEAHMRLFCSTSKPGGGNKCE